MTRSPAPAHVHSSRPGLRLAAAATLAGLVLTVGAAAGATAVPEGAVHHAGRTPPVLDDPADSGTLGPWRTMGRSRSTTAVSRAVAGHRRGVLLVGDSITSSLRRPLEERLAARTRPMAWDIWSGRPTEGTADAVADLARAGALPPTLVVVSGSNDIFAPAAFPDQVERVLRAAGPHRVIVWVLPEVRRRTTALADVGNSRILAADLRRAAARHRTLRLVDWPGHLTRLDAPTRAAVVPDGVHPSARGARELARLVDAALR